VLPFVNLSSSQTDDHLADDLVNKVMEVRADGSIHVR
jgi:TolB-like protein